MALFYKFVPHLFQSSRLSLSSLFNCYYPTNTKFVPSMTELAMNSSSSLDSTFTQYQINIELSNG